MGILRYLLRAIQCSQWGSLLPRSWNLLVSIINVLTTACLLLHASQAKSGSCTLPSPSPLSVCPAVTTEECQPPALGVPKERPRQGSHRHVATRQLLPLLNPALAKAGPDMSWDTVRSAPTCDLLLSKPKLDFRVGGMMEDSAPAPVPSAFGLFSQNKTWNLVQNRKKH